MYVQLSLTRSGKIANNIEIDVARLLANASEQDIQVYQQDLGKVKNRTSTDLQYNAYQNRSQFIKISQEADKLKGEMRALRNLMSDLTSTLNQTNAALGINTSDTVSARKYANRSSVANLEAMWSTHLQELWRRVEGSQKFLPAIPGRHVVHESGKWVELNTATFKPRRRVHLILLNDHFLIACEKKRMDGSPNPEGAKLKAGASHNQLVADKCLPIQEVEVVDLASPQDGRTRRNSQQHNIGNAINVRVGGESFTFATMGSSDLTEKTTFLAKFRKAVADMRKLLHADIDDHAMGGASSRKRLDGSNANLPKSPGQISSTTRGSMLVEVDGQQQNFRWVENQVDELDIAIALQRFEDAVERVDKLRRIAKSNKNNSVVQDLVDGKVQERATKLAKSITRQLVERSSYLNATKKHTGWLIKLGFEARASEAFLEARGDALIARSGHCVNTGDLHQYMYQVSFTCFTMIRNTVRIYQACFPQNTTSACVRWAKRHVDEFNALLARQVNRLPKENEERNACMDTVKAHAEMLGEVSIDFRNLVGQGVEDG